MKKINIAIDGYSACGKSSTAKEVAKRLDYTYIDTGAMYRAVTYFMQQHHIDWRDEAAIENGLKQIDIRFHKVAEGQPAHTFLNGEDVELQIRQPEVAALVSEVSTISAVRRKLVEEQQEMAIDKGVVMDGRDIGSVVLPDAELKFFMTADLDIRARRRQKELIEKTGRAFPLEELKANLIHRDKIDSSRADSPLTQVPDAIVIDTTNLTLGDQIDQIMALARQQIDAAG
jgi:cytidylate kinase